MSDLISRADAIGIIEDYIGKDYMTPMSRLCSVRSELSALPSAEAVPMTEEVREALMRLTMCAREECGMCKYKDECDFDFQYKISTDNMNTLADALLRSRCEVDAKSAEAVQGEWIDTEFLKLKECSCCHNRWGVYSIEEFDFCPSCGARMKGGAE